MSLSSGPMGFAGDALSGLHATNANLSAPTTFNFDNNNHNHYRQTNQYQRPTEFLGTHSRLLSSILLPGGLNRTNKHPIAASNYDSNRAYSFLFSDQRDALYLSTPGPLNDPQVPDYDNSFSSADHSVQDVFVEGSHLWSLLVVGYALVFTIGVFGNSALLAALCGTGGRARSLPVRNHLMVNLAAADLLVTAVCVPISACAAASHACWPSYLCQLGPIMQRTPVACSTFSLALLSLDRWAAIRHPRFAQRFRERKFVAMSMAMIWILASLVAAPTYMVRQWTDNSSWSTSEEFVDDDRNSSWTGDNGTPEGVCVERWTNVQLQLTYAATYLGTVFVSPALIVAACHASVSYKLTTQLKLLSGATSSDRFISNRPRPKQVLIVARDPSNNIIPNPMNPPENQPAPHVTMRNNSSSRSGSFEMPARPSKKFIPCDPNSDDEDDVFVRMQIEADLESLRQISQHQHANSSAGSRRSVKSFATFRSEPSVSKSDNNNMLKASKRETSIIRAHRRLRKKLNVPSGGPMVTKLPLPPTPLLPMHSSQSFKSRRRAANLLSALAGVFCVCWLPYVLLGFLEMFLKEKSLVRFLIPFSLFLGHAHSAINPVVSWRLNRSAFVRFQRESILSFLPEWLRSFSTCRLCCYSCSCPVTSCCDNSSGTADNDNPTPTPGQGASRARPPALRRAATRYPVINENRNPFIQTPERHRQGAAGRRPGESSGCCTCTQQNEHAVPCCCCFCSCNMFVRRSSSSDLWNRNTSTNEAALGAFHPKYLSRLPAPDPVSRCHTSHFLR